MGRNLDKNQPIDHLQAQAKQRFQEAQEEVLRVEQLQKQLQQEALEAQLHERQALLDNAKDFLAKAQQEALQGNLSKAESLKAFAADAQKLASEMIIDGESLADIPKATEEGFFGQGYTTARRWLLTGLFTLLLFALSSYLNHLVKLEGTDISLAIRTAWIDFILKLNHWSILWLVVDVSLLIHWSVVYRFRNNHQSPEHNLNTKWFLNTSDEFQVKQSLYLLYAKVFSFAIMYMASPITNS